jgi:allene oxide cyclase-like protein
MRKAVTPFVLVLVFASGGAALASTGHPGKARTSAKPRSRTFTVYTSTSQFNLVDLAPQGFSLGDEDVFTDDVFTHRGGARLGIDGGVCSVVRVADAATFSGTLQCLVTYSLKGGQITAQGLARVDHALYSGAHSEAITGGTGRYRNARGETRVSFLNSADTAAKVAFTLSPG